MARAAVPGAGASVTRAHLHGRPRRARGGPPPRLRGQRGNALVFALLGLLVSGLAALAAVQARRLEARQAAGAAEAGILQDLRNAANAAILEQLVPLQHGQPLARQGHQVAPDTENGTPTWRPTVDDLRAMGYLPPQWTLDRSVLNGAPYAIAFHLTPAGCAPADCGVDGSVVLAGPLTDGRAGDGAATDSAVIGALLTRLGADSAVSLATAPGTLQGFGGTWSQPNPVAGQPAGVVAARLGTTSSTWSPFVRIGDTRDPDLAGPFSVAGNVTLGAAGATHAATVNGTLSVRDAAGHDCAVLSPDGALDLHCTGHLGAASADFTDAAGRRVAVGAGRVTATDGFATPAVTAFAADAPTAIDIASGDLSVRGPGGASLASVTQAGNVQAAHDVVAGDAMQGARLTLTQAVDEGDGCQRGDVATLADGGLAVCADGAFRAVDRSGRIGSDCAAAGQTARDVVTGARLICRMGRYASLNDLLASKVLMATELVKDGTDVDVATLLPGGCPAMGGGSYLVTIYLMPAVDANAADNTILNRLATPTARGWHILLTDGSGAPTQSSAIAYIYCEYR